MTRSAVFLDRDGVINRTFIRDGTPHPPVSLRDLEILPHVPEALSALKAQGYSLVVVTNQPDVGAGKMARPAVEGIHAHLLKELPIDAVKVCYHVEADSCSCRKPRPGMLLEAAREFKIDLVRSSLVGDRWRDVGAAQAAGCRAYFIDWGYAETKPDQPYVAVESLPEAVALILRYDQR